MRELTSEDVKRLGLGHLLKDAKPAPRLNIKLTSEDMAARPKRKRIKRGRNIVIKNGEMVDE